MSDEPLLPAAVPDLPQPPAPPRAPPDVRDVMAAAGGAVRAWWGDGARVLAFRAPRWPSQPAGPATVAVLVVAGYLLHFGAQWALMEGAPLLVWRGFLAGWAGIAVTAWLCWVVARSGAVAASTLFALGASAGLVMLPISIGLIAALQAVMGPFDSWALGLQMIVWLLPLCWMGLAQLVLLWRAAGSALARAAAVLLVPVPLLLNGWLAPPVFWWTPPAAGAEAAADAEPETGLPLTDDSIARQARLLDDALQAVRPPQPGRVNVYAATYAPNASEDVFMRESAVVARTMRERFGAEGRLVELVANRATSDTLPWGTPANLRAAIARLAAVMDRDRDVLFLHLTSHGGADGRLATDTWPLKTEEMTPGVLKRWLDEAGVRWRVISVSACYSGSWIAPLAGDGTLVMTAADAEHTSYGCGKRSELTFFGRAMYDEELRKTWSFTEAHAAARLVIDQREKDAGKKDGYSNPQISMGAGIEPVLGRLAEQQRAR